MPDVRKYIVCFGLETMLGQLCNINGLEMCEENGDPVAFGEDAYYEQIFVEDFRGFDFQKQRDAWREGTDFTFAVEFFAKSEGGDMSAGVIDTEVVSDAPIADSIDAEVVEKE